MKRHVTGIRIPFLLVLALLSLTRPGHVHGQGQTTCTPPPSGIVSWWPADGNANDIIGGNNGTLVGGVTFTPTTCPGCFWQALQAYALNAEITDPANHVQRATTAGTAGSSAPSWNDSGGNTTDGTVTWTDQGLGQAFSFTKGIAAVLVPNNSNLNFANFTLEAWVNLKTPISGTEDAIVTKYDNQVGRVGPHSGYQLFLEPDTHQISITLFSSGQQFTSVGSVQVGMWTHVAAVRQGNQVLFYINGQLDSSAVTTAPATTNMDPLVIGAFYDTSRNPPFQPEQNFGGLIDEVQVFNVALKASDIQAAYNAGSAGCKGCQATAPGAPQPPGFIGTVSVFPGGPYSLDGSPTVENAAFIATDANYSPIGLIAAARACGFSGFNWQQEIEFLPAPSPFSPLTPSDNLANLSANGSLQAPPPFFDPPPGGGYGGNYPGGADYAYPFYWDASDVSQGQVPCTHGKPFFPFNTPVETANVLYFQDCAGNPLLPNGSYVRFQTSLVGVLPCPPGGNCPPLPASAPLFTFSWLSSFNGTTVNPGTGGVAQLKSILPIDPSTGSGGVTITSLNGVSVMPNPPSGTACNGVYNGTFNGSITVSNGQTCTFVGGSIAGDVQVTGGTLVLSGASVGGDVNVNGGSFYIGPSATISGDLKIQNIPAGSAQNQICGSTVSGDLEFLNNGTAVQIGSSLPAACPGNMIGGDLVVNSNTASTQVFNNSIQQDLSCQGNSSITGGGNTASSKNGQCAGF